MVYGVYSVFDAAIGLYLQPFFMRTDKEAVRAVGVVLTDPNHQFARNPEDFTLFRLGDWTEADGSFKCGDPMRMITLLQLKSNLEK